jgi:hypothetical protein
MAHLPHSVELHDSRAVSIATAEGALVIQLRPAYVHNQGKGWRQDADLIVNRGSIEGPSVTLPTRIADGNLKTPRGPYHNLLTLPLNDPGPISLELEFESGELVRVEGASIEVRLFGEPQFVEDYA